MIDSALMIALDPLYRPPDLKIRMSTTMQPILWQLYYDEDLDSVPK